jgi:hypothetical protein
MFRCDLFFCSLRALAAAPMLGLGFSGRGHELLQRLRHGGGLVASLQGRIGFGLRYRAILDQPPDQVQNTLRSERSDGPLRHPPQCPADLSRDPETD